jgi:vacuolar-type H+-ATPase subunit H
MPSDAFERVRQTEMEAENIILAAKRKAAAIVEQAGHESARLLEENLAASKRNAAAKIAAVERENQKTLSQVQSSVDSEKAALIKNARQHTKEAVTKIINVLAVENE